MLFKIFVVIFSILFLSNEAIGQFCFPAKTIYSYFQPVTKGAAAKGESKPVESRREETGNYFIYLSSKKEGLVLLHTWIRGILHNADLKLVPSPVILKQNFGNSPYMNKPAVELVPKTNKKIYQLVFKALDANRVPGVIPGKYSDKPIVIEVQYKNKRRYLTADSIRTLERIGMN